jgi:hypothetical protein
VAGVFSINADSISINSFKFKIEHLDKDLLELSYFSEIQMGNTKKQVPIKQLFRANEVR